MPIIQLKKVNNAVEAFSVLERAQDEFDDAFNELNDAETKRFCEITGATITKKSSNVDEQLSESKK